MLTRDTELTTLVLQAFKFAWQKAIEDYQHRRINSEHCLQASLYRHLKNILPDTFNVYAEAVIRLGENATTETGKSKVVVDLLVCDHHTIVAGIELKYTPRIEPSQANVSKDLASLAHITRRKRHIDRVKIEMPRFRSSDEDTITLDILPQRKLIMAAFCTQEAELMREDAFWLNFRPNTGYWKSLSSFPPNLCVALAQTNSEGKAHSKYFGPAFGRLNTPHAPLEDDA